MDETMCLQTLFCRGLGYTSQNETRLSTSIEGYDGYDDEIYAAVTRSEESLKFLDTYELMENKKTSDKLKMLKKINANYNSKTIGNAVAANSIESYVQSLEEETNASKKQNFFKTVWEGIKKFFKTVWDYVKKFFTWVKNKIQALFKSKKPEDKKFSILDTSSPKELVQIVNQHNDESNVSKTEPKEETVDSNGTEETTSAPPLSDYEIQRKRCEAIYEKLMKFNPIYRAIVDKIYNLCKQKEMLGYIPVISKPKFGSASKPTGNNRETMYNIGKEMITAVKKIISSNGKTDENTVDTFKKYDDTIRKISNGEYSVINCGLEGFYISCDAISMQLDKIAGDKSMGVLEAEYCEKAIFGMFNSSDDVKKMFEQIVKLSNALTSIVDEYNTLEKTIDDLFKKISDDDRNELQDVKISADRRTEIRNASHDRMIIAETFSNGLKYVNFLVKYESYILELYGAVYNYLC